MANTASATRPPTAAVLPASPIRQWVAASLLKRRGILERDEDSYLTLDGLEDDPLQNKPAN